MGRPWKPMRRCDRSCGAIREKSTKSFCAGWPGNQGLNEDWVNPHDPGAEITKMKDGRTHLAYKAEHAVDLETGAVVAVTVSGGAAGDTQTMLETLPQAGEHIAEVAS